MTILPLIEVLPQLLGSVVVDDSSVSVLGMLLGVATSMIIMGRRQQARARRVEDERRKNPSKRTPD